MNAPHYGRGRGGQASMNGEIPPGQERALHRRRALEAEQRAFRDTQVNRPAGASAADLAPVRLRVSGDRPNG